MDSVKKLEDAVSGLFKGVPPLSASAKEGLAKAWPWIALIFGIFQLLAAWGLWRLTHVSAVLEDVAVYYVGRDYGLSGMDKTVIYMGIAVLLADAVMLLMAYPHLVKRAARGWDLLFLGALLNLAYSVVSIFIDGRGFGSFIFSLLGSAIGFYLLFQVREKFTRKNT